MLQMRIWAILDHFISFFHLSKSKNFWRLYDRDKDYKWQTFNTPVISIRWFPRKILKIAMQIEPFNSIWARILYFSLAKNLHV